MEVLHVTAHGRADGWAIKTNGLHWKCGWGGFLEAMNEKVRNVWYHQTRTTRSDEDLGLNKINKRIEDSSSRSLVKD